jgi:hypothetical protein
MFVNRELRCDQIGDEPLRWVEDSKWVPRYLVAKRLPIQILGRATGLEEDVFHLTLDWRQCRLSGHTFSSSGDRDIYEHVCV